jgi:hypothetical protein
MLGEDYPRLLGSLMAALPQRIELPPGQEGFFEESGPHQPYQSDPRGGVRNRIRTRGLLLLESWYPAFDRHPQLMLIYTADFSKTGFGLMAPEQFYPGEVVRVFLATFWMRVTIRRCRRLSKNCYNSGGTLLNRHEPDDEAMESLTAAQSQFA